MEDKKREEKNNFWTIADRKIIEEKNHTILFSCSVDKSWWYKFIMSNEDFKETCIRIRQKEKKNPNSH